ncbi:hypothetical protein GOBAR_DD22897 [Gossypium barbadense]|nr:hypothetical protein GOBAR_DD22897 [Gossypium barbadense]
MASLSGGEGFLCGITANNSQTFCWDLLDFGINLVPKAFRYNSYSQIAAGKISCLCYQRGLIFQVLMISVMWIAGNLIDHLVKNIVSGDGFSCGIAKETGLIFCWGPKSSNLGIFNVSSEFEGANKQSSLDYSPPLQLCSLGVCSLSSCTDEKFTFNASILNEPELTSLCAQNELQICLPCGTNCSVGYFPSSTCTANADRICTHCSLCQRSYCWDRSEGKGRIQCGFCIGKPVAEADPNPNPLPPLSLATYVGETQIYRLSELKDATHGFKEFSELERGSFGFVYKVVLPDGRQVAVKRANAVTIIHTNSWDFEVELEILCNVKHTNIVNLLGYCVEMGERDVKTSIILLDSEWGARIADFHIVSATTDNDLSGNMEDDVYNFGIVLLEVLSGRKTYDRDCTPPEIVYNLAELLFKENPSERPSINNVVSSLEQIFKCELILS